MAEQKLLPDDPTFRSRSRGLISDFLYAQPLGFDTEREAVQKANDLMTLLEFSPVGALFFGEDIVNEAKKGNVGTASAMLGIGALPVVGPTVARGARGMLSSGPNLMNRIAQGVPTDQGKKFYQVGPFNQLGIFGSSFLGKTGAGIRESIDPVARANYRVRGVTEEKAKEIASETRDISPIGTAISMANQIDPNPKSLIQQTFGKIHYLGTNITNTKILKTLIGNGNRKNKNDMVPDVVVDRAVRHLTQGPHQRRSLVDRGLNPNLEFKYQVKDPLASGYVALRDASGTMSDGANLARFLKSENFSKYEGYLKTTFNDPKRKLSQKDIIEASQISATLSPDVVKQIKQIAQLPEEMKSTNLAYQILQARARQRAGKKPSGKIQQKVLNTFNGLLTTGKVKLARLSDEKGNIVNHIDYDKIKVPEGHVFTQQSFVSKMQKDLGGMNNFFAIDTKKKHFYSMTNDGHDILGVNPPSGSGLVTASPLVKVKMGAGANVFNPNQFKNTLVRKTKNAVKLAKQKTKIQPNKNESGPQYLRRVLVEAKAEPTQKDILAANASRAKLLGAGLLTGAGITGVAIANNKEEQGVN
jgi:hypothetical protein